MGRLVRDYAQPILFTVDSGVAWIGYFHLFVQDVENPGDVGVSTAKSPSKKYPGMYVKNVANR